MLIEVLRDHELAEALGGWKRKADLGCINGGLVQGKGEASL